MFQVKAKVIDNKRVKGNYFHCIFNAPRIQRKAKSGQFVNIKITDGTEPLLRRPFSIHQLNKSNIEILYEVVGEGTRLLSKKKTGEYLDIIGPLGNGFDLQCARPVTKHSLVLVAGGMGVAPLVFLAQALKRKTSGKKCLSEILVLIGARTKGQILCEKEFKSLGCSVKIATDDGSSGFHGRVTDLLKERITHYTLHITQIYACGSKPMLRAISNISVQKNIPAQISLEEHMACGIGACLGCVVDTKEGFKRVCKDGPVFEADQIIWGKE